MNRLIMAAVAAAGIFAASAAEEEETVQNWRLTVGGLARGSMKAQIGDLGSKRCEAYGADLDVQYRAFQSGAFSLWAGVGGTYLPKQRMGSDSFYELDVSDPDVTIEDGGRGTLDVAIGECRLLLVPEYAITEHWSVGARVGVAFDWVRATVKSSEWSRTDIHVPGMPSVVIPAGPYSETDRFTDFVAQAILGLQTTYMVTDNLGLYATVDYRCGGDATFEKGGDRYASLNLDGWCAGAGVVVRF